MLLVRLNSLLLKYFDRLERIFYKQYGRSFVRYTNVHVT